MEEGERNRWNEFEFTYSYLPGHTIYHGGLLVRHDSGKSIFFVDDSFTPSGMDDYCLLNRNFLAPENGFLACMRGPQRERRPFADQPACAAGVPLLGRTVGFHDLDLSKRRESAVE
jgi:hypothetical protein